jgi:UDP-N-acetylmuramate dehydrogenase
MRLFLFAFVIFDNYAYNRVMTIEENVVLAPMTTMKVGGIARYFCRAESVAEVREAVDFAKEKKIPLFILGGGSNILVSDDGFQGLVICIAMNAFYVNETPHDIFITVGSGYRWDDLVADTTLRGMWGIENLSLIPGTVGGAVVQNIGAYGVELKDVIESVEVFDTTTNATRTLTRDDCAYGYRDSYFKHEGRALIVLSATLCLSRRPKPQILYKDLREHFAATPPESLTAQHIRDAVISIRVKKFPDLSRFGTAGSYFTNPIVTRDEAEKFLLQYPDAPQFPVDATHVKLSAAWIIDHILQLRGIQNGSVGCWDAQALVIVNYGGATEKEITAFAHMIQKKCYAMCAIKIFPEVIFIK